MKAKKYWAWVGLFFVIAMFGFKIFAFADKQEEQDSLVGLRGVYVICDEIRPELERYGLAEELLESDVKSQLRQNGIKLLSIAEWNEALGQPFLYINVNGFGDKDIDFGFVSIEVEFRQVVRLSRDFNTKCFGVTWDKSKVGGYRLDNLKENTHRSVKELVGIFINDYLAANPKEANINGSSKSNFEESYSQMLSTLNKEQKGRLMEAIMKLYMDLDIGEVTSEDEVRSKGKEKIRQTLDGKSYSEIIEMAEGLGPLDERAQKAVKDVRETGTSFVYQHDADIVRLKHIKYLGGLIEEFYQKTGYYPLQSDNDIENYVYIASPTQKKYVKSGSEYQYKETEMYEFKAVLEKGLGQEISLPFDPQLHPVNKPNFYIYMIKGNQYFLAVHLYDGGNFARKIAPYYFKAEISNMPVPEQKLFTYNQLMKEPEYQKRIGKEFIIKAPKNPE